MSNEDVKISVIVPAYNVQKYLERCINSILNQTYQNLEILIIDDGSTDDTGKMCDEYQKKDSRIKVIHQENKGLSAARNTGIDLATGDYLMFVDSDDEILPQMIETLNNIRLKTKADISMCSYYEIKEGEEIVEDNYVEPKVFTGTKKHLLIYRDWGNAVVQWNKLFNRKIFEHLRFPEGKFHEDEFIYHREYDLAERVALTKQRLYIYYQHKESITKTPNIEKKYHICLAYMDRIEYYEKAKMNEPTFYTIERLELLIKEIEEGFIKNLDDKEFELEFNKIKEYVVKKKKRNRLNYIKQYLIRKKRNFPIYIRIKYEELKKILKHD